ncbi:salivary glue protein Sgs-3-like [Branchiostoma lanceolatum]|uniref:salivary glue protein Sgs-3-like n=1 Tax=Branchiostoma lanceolatum TaxID=7740 RepID=UPI003453BE32
MAGLRLLLALSAVVFVVDGQRFGEVSEGKCPDLPVKANFSVKSYMGRWYEIARFPVAFERSLKCAEAHYYLHRHGGIKVFTKGIDSYGHVARAVGRAYVPDPRVPSKLSIGFSRFLPKGPYWVLDTDYSSYAVVWSCVSFVWGLFKVEMAWILGRERTLDEDIMKDIVYEVTEMGIDAALFRMTDQTDCPGIPTTTVVPPFTHTPQPSNTTTNVTTPPSANVTTPIPSNTTSNVTTQPPANVTTPTPSNTTTNFTTPAPTNVTTPIPSNTTTNVTTLPPTNVTTPLPANTTTNVTTPPPSNVTTPIPSNTTTNVTAPTPTNVTTPIPSNTTSNVTTPSPAKVTTPSPSNATTNVTEMPPTNTTTQSPANITTNITEMPPDFNTTTPPSATTARTTLPCRRKKNKKGKKCSPSSRKNRNKSRNKTKDRRPYN